MKALRKIYVEGGPIWVDKRRTKAESATVRAVHRIAELLKDLEAARGPPGVVIKELPTKSVWAAHRGVRCVQLGASDSPRH